MKTISFDLGGSGGKLYLGEFTGERLSLSELYRFPNKGVPMGGGLYWDFLAIYNGMREGLAKAGSIVEKNEPVTMGIDSFCNDFGLIDSQGTLLTQVHCYRDERTVRTRQAIDAVMPPSKRHQITGNQVALCNTLMHVAAMCQEGRRPQLESAHKLLLVPDLLAYYLTGRAVSEYTVSSVTEMFEFRSGTWSDHILAAYGIPRHLLQDIVQPGTEVGMLTGALQKELRLSGAKVISVCEHDTASAYLSAPCEGASAIISSGTWSLIGTETEHPVISDKTYLYNISNEGGYPGSHHRVIKCGMGLWLMQEIQGHFAARGKSYSFAELDGLGEKAEPFAFLIDPDDDLFFGQGNMPDRIYERCVETMGRGPETVGDFVRCIKESLAFKYRWSIEKLEEVTGRSLPVIHVVGGGSKDEILCQYTADVCGRPVIAGPADATALGNAMVQLISQGELSGVKQGRQMIRQSCHISEYEPQNTAAWEEQYQYFIEHICTERRK